MGAYPDLEGLVVLRGAVGGVCPEPNHYARAASSRVHQELGSPQWANAMKLVRAVAIAVGLRDKRRRLGQSRSDVLTGIIGVAAGVNGVDDLGVVDPPGGRPK